MDGVIPLRARLTNGRQLAFDCRKSPYQIVAHLTLAAWAVVMWHRRPPSVVEDWMGWRQADTMAIARNFVERPSGLLWPRIDWGGAGPGFVETELQIVPWIIATLHRFGVDLEQGGQCFSLLVTSVTGALLWGLMQRRYGPSAALLGLLAWLSNQGVVFAATAVQPDVLSLLLSVFACIRFARYVENPRLSTLASAGLATALAALVKPTALQLGVVQFVWLLLARRSRLRSLTLWLTWAMIVGSVVLLLLHGKRIYDDYGNTFGILSGGDSKLPRLEHLRHPGLLLHAISVSLDWGIGWLGGIGCLILLLRRRLDAMETALLCGSLVLLVVALRYTCNYHYGTHYHLPTTLLGALCVAHVAADWSHVRWKLSMFVGAVTLSCVVGTISLRHHLRSITEAKTDEAILVGRTLGNLVRPGELVVVRGLQNAWDDWWKTRNNFEDPRTLYVAHARGWVLSADDDTGRSLRNAVQLGARWYVEWGPHRERPDFDRALIECAQLAYDGDALGRIWRLLPPTVTQNVPTQ